MSMQYHKRSFNDYQPKNFLWNTDGKVATLTLNRPDKKNPLTFDSYAELRDLFRDLNYDCVTTRPYGLSNFLLIST